MTPDQLARILDAISAMRSPWWSSLLPVVTALIGAAIGFFFSRISQRLDRKIRRSERAIELAETKRREAITLLVQTSISWMERFETGHELSLGDTADKLRDAFLLTGIASDSDVGNIARGLLIEVDAMLRSYNIEHEDEYGNQYVTWDIPLVVESRARKLLDNLRKWLFVFATEDRESEEFGQGIGSTTELIRDLRHGADGSAKLIRIDKMVHGTE